MTEINNCENCHHYNSLIHWEEGLFHQCMMGNKLWEKCNDYDAIKELERMTEKRYKSIGANLECPNGMEYMLIKRNDGFNVCQVCSKYTAKEIVDELNSLADENEQLKQQIGYLIRELKTEMETSISRNERIRLDFAITVLESLKR